MKKALIIGAGGFVGAYLIEHLHSLGTYELYATKMGGEQLPYEYVQVDMLDILEREAIDELLGRVRPDVIFHLAALSSVALSWKKPQLTIDINIKGTVNLLDSVRNSGLSPRVLLVGSGEEYGHVREKDVPIKEETYLRPGNIYAATKACQNMFGSIYADAYDLDIVMVRAFNHIGPGQSDLFVVSDFCKQVAEIEKGIKEPVIKVGNLASRRDFTDVRDVVRAYALLASSGQKGELYNVGSGDARSIQEILDMILDRATREISVVIDETRFRPVDVPIIEADIGKLGSATGWKPQIDIEQTVQETLEYWRAHL